jgi:hypothetical protein
MAKLKCICGHIIIGQTDNIPYKGYILPDTEVENVSDALTAAIETLIDAINSNKRLDWIRMDFEVPAITNTFSNAF